MAETRIPSLASSPWIRMQPQVRFSRAILRITSRISAGEIGPVGGKNFLHGFTASIALFVDA